MTYLAELSNVLVHHKAALSAVKLVVFDVDGVLTDGRLHYTAEGESQKVFHVRDGVGLKLLQDMGIVVAIVTAKDSEMVARRVSELGIQNYIPGSKDKLAALKRLVDVLGLETEQCCFVGDDMVDLPAMQAAGISVCPEDAYPLVAEVADVCLTIAGGQGVARRVCDLILAAQGHFESAYRLASSEEFERKR